MPESLENQFISDLYTSLIHLSGAELGPAGPLNQVFDGAGNSTGLALSGKRVIVNNYIYPEGFETRDPIEWLDAFFPVGCLQLTFDDNNPTDRIAGTTWKRVAQGRFLVGTGTLTDKNGVQREFCPGGEEEEAQGKRGGSGDIAGEYEVTLTPDQLPAHTHNVDIGAVDVQISNPAGTGTTQSSPRPGATNSTLSFAEQVQARLSLGKLLNVYPNSNYSQLGCRTVVRNEDEQQNSPWLYALDFEFGRGSAAVGVMSEEQRALYMVGDFAERYQFKEMIGIWNGESRFVADVPVLVGGGFATGQGTGGMGGIGMVDVFSTLSPYEYAKRLGAIDIGEAEAGDYETSHNETPIYSGDTSVLEGEEGSGNAVDSGPTGEDKAHNNILPSYGVYVWKRIA
tara:strand:- start:23 stop:1213 length:1191 start_codon:yes stop_codon:yes gene_type:complete